MYGKQSYRMGSQGKKRSREEGENNLADNFALFQAIQSSNNDKCLYIPVPIRYQVRRDLNIFNSHSGSAVTSSRIGKEDGYGVKGIEEERVRTDLRSCPLLKMGFRAFGKVVGHFILRKIASAGRQAARVRASRRGR